MVGDVSVSTIFLGVDHGYGEGPPVLFETMVFGGYLDGEQNRYCTRQEALKGHRQMVKKIKKPDPPPAPPEPKRTPDEVRRAVADAWRKKWEEIREYNQFISDRREQREMSTVSRFEAAEEEIKHLREENKHLREENKRLRLAEVAIEDDPKPAEDASADEWRSWRMRHQTHNGDPC